MALFSFFGGGLRKWGYLLVVRKLAVTFTVQSLYAENLQDSNEVAAETVYDTE